MNTVILPAPAAAAKAAQLSLENITEQTPMGGTLLPAGTGATFRVWAPNAQQVQLHWAYEKNSSGQWEAQKVGDLTKIEGGHWVGFVPRLTGADRYMYHVKGPRDGTEGLKRDPYARDLTDDPMWPTCQCLLYDSSLFPWHDQGWRPPMFHELVIYQLHIGTCRIREGRQAGSFLDIIEMLPYLKSLNINAIQPLPIVEFPTMFSLGYNGMDYFSPETDYGVFESAKSLKAYLAQVNKLMSELNPALAPYELKDIKGTANQFRMMVDMCHLFGIAVLMDVVYNHAGGGFDDASIYFFDRQEQLSHNQSLYFSDKEWAGGLLFDYGKDEVRQFLVDNALFYLQECHCDGFRYDEISVLKNVGGADGWRFCRDVTSTCHFVKPEAIHIAECWPVEQAIVMPTDQGGAGFDASQNDGLRDAIRNAVGQASVGCDAFVDMDRIAQHIKSPALSDGWRAVQCAENHDIVYRNRHPRLPALADSSNCRSWYARSRSRVAMGMVATAMGIPHIFMGQEILEDKQWHDEPNSPYQIWWDGLEQDQAMSDFLRFSRELFDVRNDLPALRATGLNVFHTHNDNRVLAFHRWVEGEGKDVVVVMSLNESTFWEYELGMPVQGHWHEVFNSDVYDNWVNPQCAGNAGHIQADERALHNLPASARIVIPANSILIFAK